MVGEGAKRRGGSRAEASRATQPLGGGDGLAPTAVRRIEVEELGRLGDHRANSFCSMNLAGSKLIERNRHLSSKNCEKAVPSW
jgi:hypothetical protein